MLLARRFGLAWILVRATGSFRPGWWAKDLTKPFKGALLTMLLTTVQLDLVWPFVVIVAQVTTITFVGAMLGLYVAFEVAEPTSDHVAEVAGEGGGRAV